MDNHDEILNDFKSCTGIDDNAEAILHLEAANWDLLQAISGVLPNDSQKLPSETSSTNQINTVTVNDESTQMPQSTENLFNNGSNIVVSNDLLQSSSTESIIRFIITNDNNGLKNRPVYEFELYEKDTIRTLKDLIRAKSEIPPCHQLLVGWPVTEPENDTEIRLLELPDVVHLSLFSVLSTDNERSTEVKELYYTLIIQHETANKTFRVTFPGTKYILDVKHGIFSLVNIPFSQQIWSGWPEDTNDYTTLANSGIDYPEHHLSVKGADTVVNNNNVDTRKRVRKTDSDDSNEEEEEEPGPEDDEMNSLGGDDITFEEFSTHNNWRPLIPEQFENESVASYAFSYEFENRYGGLHPQFFIGTFDEALREACFRPAKDRKLLALYLHHDKSVLTNVFCTQLLCFDSVIQYLTNHFIIWGWDLTLDSNKEYLLNMIGEKLSPLASGMIRSSKVDKLPILVIITRARGNSEILTIINGTVSLNELISSLIQAVDIFTEQREVEVLEEEDRDRRELIKVEQDAAYQQSLDLDRAKEETRRVQEQLEMEKLTEINNAKLANEKKKEADRQLLESQLPPEPNNDNDNEFVTKIRIRLPTNVILERKFLISEKFQVLINYITVNGFPTIEYKLCTSFPRRDLTMCNVDSTLEELKLFPQETLVVERR